MPFVGVRVQVSPTAPNARKGFFYVLLTFRKEVRKMAKRNNLIILIIIWLVLGVFATILNNISAEGDNIHTSALNVGVSSHQNL